MQREITTIEGPEPVEEVTYLTMCFDDLVGLSPEFQAMCANRGLLWMTKLTLAGGRVGMGLILAGSEEQTAKVALERGIGETVVGPAYAGGATYRFKSS